MGTEIREPGSKKDKMERENGKTERELEWDKGHLGRWKPRTTEYVRVILVRSPSNVGYRVSTCHLL